MGMYLLDNRKLWNLDKFFHIEDPDSLDEEIEGIVENLWDGIGAREQLLRPFFTTFLQTNLLRPLYIHYFSLCELKKRYRKIEVTASTVIVDILAHHLGCRLSPQGSMHDKELYLLPYYHFSRKERSSLPYWKRMLFTIGGAFVKLAGALGKVDVLYLNAGKLDKEFSRMPRAVSAKWVALRRSGRMRCNVEAIAEKVRENITCMELSIPNEIVRELVELRVLAYLSDVIDRIGSLADFIEKYKIRLVIASAVTHEDHLCLLAAARLAGVDSLILAHGITLAQNPFLHDYASYQATMSDIEPRYANAHLFPLRSYWFHG